MVLNENLIPVAHRCVEGQHKEMQIDCQAIHDGNLRFGGCTNQSEKVHLPRQCAINSNRKSYAIMSLTLKDKNLLCNHRFDGLISVSSWDPATGVHEDGPVPPGSQLLSHIP